MILLDYTHSALLKAGAKVAHFNDGGKKRGFSELTKN